MSSQAPPKDAQVGATTGTPGQMLPVEPLLAEVIATLALAAHSYMSDDKGEPDLPAAEVAIDVATAAFERVKERMKNEERLAITQMLTETRLTFVRKRGL